MQQAVSVIVPVYNAAEHLAKSLQSLVSQTYTDLEILVVDDGSTDQSLAVCRTFAERDPRIRVIAQENAGAAAARNTALREVAGTFVCFVDADDYVEPDFIADLARTIGQCDVATCSLTHEDANGEHRLVPSIPRNTNAAFIFSSPCTRLYRTDFLRRNGIEFPTGVAMEDIVFSYRWWTRVGNIAVTTNHGYHYVHHASTTTSALSQSDFATRQIFEHIFAFVKEIAEQSTPFDRQIAFYTAKLNLYLMMQKRRSVSFSSFYTEWQANESLVESIIATAQWRTCHWLRGERLYINAMMTGLRWAKALRLTRPYLWILYKI